jgi:hypothetical protein
MVGCVGFAELLHMDLCSGQLICDLHMIKPAAKVGVLDLGRPVGVPLTQLCIT